MGVLGFTPFLQKACPNVIKELPTRLRALVGKTIAIDGNLITQRLHYGAVLHDYKHVIGWYKIVQDLRANGVGVICVWDGKERGSAKAQEQARRQALRLLSFARGSHELSRLRRLQRLTTTVKKFQRLPQPERLQVSRAVRLAVGATAEAQLLNLANAMDKIQLSDPVEAAVVAPPEEHRKEEMEDVALRTSLLAQLYPLEEREALASFLINIDPSDVSLVSAVDSAYEATLTAIEDNARPQDGYKEEDTFFDVPLDEASPYFFDYRPSDFGAMEIAAEQSMETPVTHTVAAAVPDTLTKVDVPIDELTKQPHAVESDASPTRSQPLEPVSDTTPDLPLAPTDPPRRPIVAASGPSSASSVPSKPAYAATPELTPSSAQTLAADVPPPLVASAPTPTLVITLPPPNSEAAAVAVELAALYQDFYESSQSALTHATKLDAAQSPTPAAAGEEAQEPEALTPSKYQIKLTEDEKLFWHRLTADAAERDRPDPSSTTVEEESVESLLMRSGQISSSYAKRNRLPTQKTYNESRRLLGAMGVPCIEAEYPFEAEGLAASLVIHGFADFVGSEDTDVLVYDAPLLRGLTSRNLPLAIISGPEVRNALQLSRESFLDFALLLGTDFTQRVKNLGPHTAIKLIREHGSIEKVLQSQTKFVPETPAIYFQQVEVARLVFTTLPPVPDLELLQQGQFRDEEVQAILEEYRIQSGDLRDDASENSAGKATLGRNYYADDPLDPSGSGSKWYPATL